MDALKTAVTRRGKVLGKDILKVDSFLNHTVDTQLMEEIGAVFASTFDGAGITKVLTVETGGIAPAYATAVRLGVPMVFVKKTEPSTMLDPVSSTVFSYTKNKTYSICMERGTITPADKALFIDDFMANGEALKGVERLLEQTGCTLAGIGICIEKRFQAGHPYVKEKGYKYVPLVSIAGFKDGKVLFAD